MLKESKGNDIVEGETYVSPINDAKDPLLRRKRAAKYIDKSPGTLAVWDCTKRHDLKPVKIGRAVYYRKSELDRFLYDRMKNMD